MESRDRYLLRKHREIALIELGVLVHRVVAPPRTISEVIARKFRAASAVKAEEARSDWQLTETHWTRRQDFRIGPFRLSVQLPACRPGDRRAADLSGAGGRRGDHLVGLYLLRDVGHRDPGGRSRANLPGCRFVRDGGWLSGDERAAQPLWAAIRLCPGLHPGRLPAARPRPVPRQWRAGRFRRSRPQHPRIPPPAHLRHDLPRDEFRADTCRADGRPPRQPAGRTGPQPHQTQFSQGSNTAAWDRW